VIDINWSAVVYDAWVDFNDLERDGRTMTLREFLRPAIDEGDIGRTICVGDGDGNAASARLDAIDGRRVRLVVDIESFKAGESP
jgi:hypothetical protein